MNSVIYSKIKNILSNFFPENEIESFWNELNNSTPDSSFDPKKDDLQTEAEISIGMDKRAQIDIVITYAEDKLEKDKFLDLLLSLGDLMIVNGELDVAEEINKDIISKTEKDVYNEILRAKAYLAIAKINWQQSIWDDAFRCTRLAYYIFTRHEDINGCAKCENMLGTIYGERGEIEKATNHFERGKAYLYNHSNLEMEAMFETNLGVLYNMQEQYPKALRNYRNSLRNYKKLNNSRLIARVHHNMGMVKTKMENYEGALQDFNECINVSLQNNYLSNCAISYIGKAYIYAKTKRSELAEVFTDKAMEIAYKLNDTLTIADTYRVKALIQENIGDLEFSEELFENSLRLNKDKKNKINEAEASEELARLYEKAENPKEAKEHMKKAIRYYKKIKAEKKVENIQEYLQSITPAAAV
ncbi:tetratricopeptide repeat protein [bacterium BMS3Abin04]|nr:tetratricopeptide repeat protein [bacterium BMS3Abin04]